MTNVITVKDFSTSVKFLLGEDKEITVSYYVTDEKLGLVIEGYPNLNIAPLTEDSLFVEPVE